jgi:hypothetical protein
MMNQTVFDLKIFDSLLVQDSIGFCINNSKGNVEFAVVRFPLRIGQNTLVVKNPGYVGSLCEKVWSVLVTTERLSATECTGFLVTALSESRFLGSLLNVSANAFSCSVVMYVVGRVAMLFTFLNVA